MDHFYMSIPGPLCFEDIYRNAINEASTGARLVEVGSWLGRTTAFMAVEIANAGKKIHFDAVGVGDGGHHAERKTTARAVGGSVTRLLESNLRDGGVTDLVTRIDEDAIGAASRYDDESIDFIFAGGVNGYDDTRNVVATWWPKVRWGGVLAGDGFERPGVAQAVHDLIPLSEIKTTGNNWAWRKQRIEAGTWVVPLRAVERNADAVVYLPFVNGRALLEKALKSIEALHDIVVIIDQSKEGVEDLVGGRVAIYRWTSPRKFTRIQNWMQREAQRCGKRFICFMHHDAECHDGAAVLALQHAAELERSGEKWACIFTNYDAFCVYNARAIKDVGCWDETFDWYVSDIDYYNRMNWRGWEKRNMRGVRVSHVISSTRAALSPEQRAIVDRATQWAEAHYSHKWGGTWHRGGNEKFRIPYNGTP